MEATLTSVEKALDVLFHLSAEGSGGVTGIGRALGLPKATTHRLLAALGRRGLVERDARGLYRPGVGLVALGLGALDREPIVAVSRPVLEAEAEHVGETLFLAGARGGKLVVLDKAEGPGFLRAAPRVGTQIPLHATAVGKLQLAFGDEAGSEESLDLERFTPKTRSSRRALERDLEQVRTRGWAESHEEWMPGLAAVAAPIRSGERLVASLALAAPAVRLPAHHAPRIARRVIAAASKIEARLRGGRP